jgi:hypothetical protein
MQRITPQDEQLGAPAMRRCSKVVVALLDGQHGADNLIARLSPLGNQRSIGNLLSYQPLILMHTPSYQHAFLGTSRRDHALQSSSPLLPRRHVDDDLQLSAALSVISHELLTNGRVPNSRDAPIPVT